MQSNRDVLQALFDHGPVTRPELAALTRLSKPTVSAAIRRLASAGLLRETGSRRGQPGRAPTCYTVDPSAGFVVGVDVGGANLRVLVADVLGATMAQRRRRTVPRGSEHVVGQVGELAWALIDELGLDKRRLLSVAVSTPGVIDPATRRIGYAYNIGQSGEFDLLGPLAQWFDAPILIQNNVNCAALAEQRLGLAREVADFAVISVGAGIGMGLVYGGRLVGGTHGAAGEIGYLPLAADPFAPEHRRRGALEDEASAEGILAMAARLDGWPGRPPESVEEIFELAGQGVAAAAEVVEAEGRMLGMAVAALCTIVDPELVVLGGGVGSNPLLLPPVRRTVGAILPMPPRIEVSQLGASASLHGAVALALTDARRSLFRRLASAPAEPVPVALDRRR